MSQTAPAMSAAQKYQQQVNNNIAARNAILQLAVKRTQLISNIGYNPANQNVINIVPQNVGLIQGFLIEVNGNIANTGSTTAITRTEQGVGTALSNVTFSDLSNYIRHNTSGWHLSTINSAKQGFVWGAAFQPNVPADWTAFNTSFANTNLVTPNWNVRKAPLTIAAGANANIREFYYLPIAYSATDLRGAIYAGTTNATMNLQLTINPAPVSTAGDPSQIMYTGNAGNWNGNVTISVYQIYYDQLPTAPTQGGGNAVVLPYLDMQQQYCLLQTTISGMTANSDFPFGYSNFRSYLSTTVMYDNAGVLNPGTDVNYISLVSANNTQIFKYTPEVAALYARTTFMADPPSGMYYFDSRQNPIATNQFGNMNLNFNFSTATAGAQMFVGTEYFAQQITASAGQSQSAG
jgi:hypothetical protein